MGVQVPLLNLGNYQIPGLKKVKKKRVRYKTPTYIKSYTFCHINPLTGELQYDSDERHIFRIRNLQNIYSIIYGYTGVNPLERVDKIKLNGITVWIEDKQAEIEGAEMLSIKQRLKLHIKLLKLLRQGCDVNNAVCQVVKEVQ